MNPWTVFVDRDGTLNVDQVHGVDVGRLELRPGAKEAIGIWRELGWRIVVVTNQSGIARGKYTQSEMHKFHEALEARLGSKLDGFFFCPHLPDAGCECRKPNVGLLRAAQRALEVDPAKSFMVGDSAADMLAGHTFGATTVWVPSDPNAIPASADFRATDLLQAALWMSQRARDVLSQRT